MDKTTTVFPLFPLIRYMSRRILTKMKGVGGVIGLYNPLDDLWSRSYKTILSEISVCESENHSHHKICFFQLVFNFFLFSVIAVDSL